MSTITIHKKLIKGEELVVIPRKEYEEFLRFLKKPERKFYTLLDADLDKSIAEYKAGKFFGPFNTTKEAVRFLKLKKSLNGKK